MVEIYSKELDNLLDHGEDHTLDYKSAKLLIPATEDKKRKIARQLVGFANQDGGKLVFGVNDDTRRPEGKKIKKEAAEGTISEVARDWCSPPIDFKSVGFYSSEQGDLTKGSVLVIQVNSSEDIPSALVEDSGGEVKRREYRLRTGDETRLVADEELKQLFRGELNPDIEETIRSWYFYTSKEPAPGYHPEPGQCHRPLNASWSQNTIAQYLTWLSDDDIERWMPESGRGLNNLIREIVPIAIVNQLSDAFRDTWHIEWKDHKIDAHGKTPEIPTEVVEIDRAKFDDSAVSNLNKTDLDWYDLYAEYGNEFTVPAGTDIQIIDSGARPVLIFENSDAFSIEIGVVMEQYPTIPTDHPYSGVQNAQRVHNMSANTTWLTYEFDILFEMKYGFPDVEDNHVESHKLFGDQLQKTLFHFWSSEVVTGGLPNKVMYEMNEKIDFLLEKMNEKEVSSKED